MITCDTYEEAVKFIQNAIYRYRRTRGISSFDPFIVDIDEGRYGVLLKGHVRGKWEMLEPAKAEMPRLKISQYAKGQTRPTAIHVIVDEDEPSILYKTRVLDDGSRSFPDYSMSAEEWNEIVYELDGYE